MNPTSSSPAHASLVHDVLPPGKEMPPANPISMAGPIKAEVVESIPVKDPFSPSHPLPPAAPSNPMTSSLQASSEEARPKVDHELDHILKAVNRKVKATELYETRRSKQKKLPLVGLDLRLLPVAAAVVVATILAVLAVSSFRQPESHYRTRAATGLMMLPFTELR